MWATKLGETEHAWILDPLWKVTSSLD